MIPQSWKLIMPPNHLGLLMSLNQQATKGVTVYNEVTDPEYQGEIELLLLNVDEKKSVWNIGDLLESLLGFKCPVIQVKGKL